MWQLEFLSANSDT